MWEQAKKRAKVAGAKFAIKVEDIQIPERCPLLGIPLVVSQGIHSPNSPSLDRFESTQGYVQGNIWVISFRANLLKSNASIVELKTLVKNMEKFHAEFIMQQTDM